jgi:hypothetical protein
VSNGLRGAQRWSWQTILTHAAAVLVTVVLGLQLHLQLHAHRDMHTAKFPVATNALSDAAAAWGLAGPTPTTCHCSAVGTTASKLARRIHGGP